MMLRIARGIPLVRYIGKGDLQNGRSLPRANTALAGMAYHSSPPRFGTALYIDHDLAVVTAEEAKTISFPLRHVEFTTCQSLKGQKTATKELKFNAAYIDTQPEADTSVPTILTLHGSPGSHLDFKHMLEGLTRHNMRVVSLNFPGFNWTPMDSESKFRHTTVEKTAFLLDFLKSIKLSNIDVLVTHSSGAYPATRLCASTNMVKSLLLVNPVGHRFMKSFKPWWYFKNHAEYSRVPILRSLLLTVLKFTLVSTKSPNKDALLMSTALETLARLDYKQQQKALKELAHKKFPVFIMYSENDNAVEAEISKELALLLGDSPERMQHYDPQCEFSHPAPKEGEQIFRGYVFEKGGHFLTRQHPDIVNQAILDLYQAIKQRNVVNLK